MAERQNHPITDAIRIRTRRSQDPERPVAGNWRAAPLALSIPTLAASVIGAPAVLAMLALRALDLVRFSPVALFPPRTVRVATMGLDKAARRYQHTCCDHGKTQASHNRSSPQIWIFKLYHADNARIEGAAENGKLKLSYRNRWRISISVQESMLI